MITLCEAQTPVLAWWVQPNTIHFTENESYILSRVSAESGAPERVLTVAEVPRLRQFDDVLPDGQSVLASSQAGWRGLSWHSAGKPEDPRGEAAHPIRIPRPLCRARICVFRSCRQRAGCAFRPKSRYHDRRAGHGRLQRDDGVVLSNLHATTSANGLLAYADGGDLSAGRLAWVDRLGKVEYLDVDEKEYGVVDLSPDDQLIAIHVADVRDYVWIWDVKRREGRRVASAEPEAQPL